MVLRKGSLDYVVDILHRGFTEESAQYLERNVMAVETVYAKIRRLAREARNNNPRTLAVMASPPTISTSNTEPTTETAIYNLRDNPNIFNTDGGAVVPYFDSVEQGHVARFKGWTTAATGSGFISDDPPTFGGPWRVSFYADATIVQCRVDGGTNIPFRVLVNGQYASLTPTTTPGGAFMSYLKIDFTSVGGKAVRLITIEGAGSTSFADARVAPTSSVFAAPKSDLLRLIVMGDSLTTGTGATLENDGWVRIFKDYIGVSDVWESGVGGTGYLNNASTFLTLRQRMPYDVLPYTHDACVFNMGINDLAFTPAAIALEASTCIELYRNTFPVNPLFIVGSTYGTAPIASMKAIELALSNMVAARATTDSNLFFVPVSGVGLATDSPYIFGTGKVGTTTGDGNADLYVTSDGVHFNTLGHAHWGRRFSNGLLEAIKDVP
jgi:lysophospholipase L1-like esterase